MVENMLRVQFASAALTHALVLSLSLGGAILLALMQTVALRRDDARLLDLTRWWAGLYLVNYVVGIGAGMLLELQFGLAFSGVTDHAGNVVGVIFSFETLTTFVVESTALAAWVFGFGVLPRRLHMWLIWVVAVSALLSVFWALLANGFLQHPEGYAVRHGQLVISNVWALLAAPELWVALGHVIGAALAATGFAVAGVSAWWLRKAGPDNRGQPEAFVFSARLGLGVGVFGSLVALVLGVMSLSYLATNQPAKRAALLGTGPGHQLLHELAKEYGPGRWMPPGWLVAPMILMVLTCLVLLGVGLWALSGAPPDIDGVYDDETATGRHGGPDVEQATGAPTAPFTDANLRWLARCAPLPLLAIACGWIVREVGRQPWTITGLLTTEQATSDVSVVRGVAVFAVVVSSCMALLAADLWLLSRAVVRAYAQNTIPYEDGQPSEARKGLTLLQLAPTDDSHGGR